MNIAKTLKSVRRKLCGLVFCIAAVVASAASADSTGTWVKRAGVGTGGTDWTSWNDTANWDGGIIASGSTAVATNSAATGQYIDIPSALSIYNIIGVDENPPVIRSDSVLSIYRALSRIYLYAPFALNCTSADAGPTAVQFCGPCTSTSNKTPQFFIAGKFRTDLYATAVGGTRNETIWPCSLNNWGGVTYYFIAPHGSDSAIIANWSLTEDSPFLSRAAGQAEHVLSVGTAVSGTGIPGGTFLKRVFPDGTIELSAAATATSASTALTFAAFDSDMTATINGNVYFRNGANNKTEQICTLYVQKYREEDEYTVLAQKLQSALTTSQASQSRKYAFKVSTENGFLPGVLSITGVQINSGIDPLKITLENCHVKIAGDDFADANFLLPGSAHTARLTVADGESHSMGALGSLKGTLVKDGAGTLGANLNGGDGSCTGTLVVESGTFAVENGGVFLSGVTIKAGATLDAPNGVHIGTLTAEPGAIISGGPFEIDSASGETMDNITLNGAFITDAVVSRKHINISVVKGEGEIRKLNADEMLATFNTNSLLRIEGCGEVDVLVVGGGGGGGSMWGGGGGGGGVIYRQRLFLTNGLYGVTVGLGGNGANSRTGINESGENSAFYGLIAVGGGAGGTYGGASGRTTPNRGVDGGSGGGGGIMYPASGKDRSAVGGAGVEGQGHDGGKSFDYGKDFLAGGGGGGAGSAGQNAATNSVGDFVGSCGGAGVMCAITGTEVYYGGGGGGAGNRTAEAGSGLGGVGGGGGGSFGSGSARGVAGTDGLGGGGGGGRAQSIDKDPGDSGGGAKGGRGVVIIRYPRRKTGFIITVL